MEAKVSKTGINCGSGQRPFKSVWDVAWINVDKVVRPDMPAPDLVCDGANIPREDASVDYFVLVQVLEHFGCGEGSALIKEAHRLLKPGGSLIVSVPNIWELCFEFIYGKRVGTSFDPQVFITSLYGAYMGSEEDRHKWGFTPASLGNFLWSHGPWKEITFGACKDIPGSSLPHDWWILEVECIK